MPPADAGRAPGIMTMRMAWYDRPGAAAEVLQVGEADIPVPGAGEVLIRVHASGINPSDCKQRRGWPGYYQDRRICPHSDGAGVIAAAGEGVDAALVGTRVWIWGARGGVFYGFADGPETGTAAEYIALPVNRIAPLPDTVSFEVGAALGGPACTAHYLIFADGDVAGRTILVRGGAGAVGQLAIAFAHNAGARVIATVSSPEKAAVARAAGAAHIIDYRQEDVAAAVLALCPAGVDRIVELDFAANVDEDVAIIRRNGVIASYSSPSNPTPVLPYYRLQFKGITVRFCQGARLPDGHQRAALGAIEAGLAAGWLRPTIGACLPLERVAEAHELVESGTVVGKVVLTL